MSQGLAPIERGAPSVRGETHSLGEKGVHSQRNSRKIRAKGAGDGLAARLGELHPEVVLSFGLPHPPAMAEVDLYRVV